MNQTLLTLICKCVDLAKISQFLPISLCNVGYKGLTKVVAQRLRNIFPFLVDHTQSNFILGQSTVNNILVHQECIHCMNNMIGSMGYMIIKLDLKKACDRLEFISKTQRILDTPPSLNNVIEHCISSSSMRIN